MKKLLLDASTLVAQGQLIEADQKLREALSIKPKSQEALSLFAHSMMLQQKTNKAIEIFRQLTKLNPKSAQGFVELGMALMSNEQHEKAEKFLQRAIELDSKHSFALHNLGNVLMHRGARKKAKHYFIKAERNDPFRNYFIDVQQALKQNDLQNAEKICRRILTHHKGHPQALHSLALIASKTDAYEEAVKILEYALKHSPYHFNLWEALINNYTILGLLSKSIAAAQKLVSIEPGEARYFILLAGELYKAGKYEESLNNYDRAIALAPSDANTYLLIGHVLKSMGRREECETAYKKSLTLEKINGTAFWSLADLKSLSFSQAEVKQMKAIIENDNVPAEQRTQSLFALAKCYEDREKYNQAFELYAQANQLKPDIRFDPKGYQLSCKKIINNFTNKVLSSQSIIANREVTPIFIVGLTRSGSTLIEQILASHSAIEGTMELYCLPRTVRRTDILCKKEGGNYPESISQLSATQLGNLGQSYLNETAIYRRGRPCFIDKMPPNFQHVGLINMILPNAIIIDVRRHPLSCGFSNFKQHFSRGVDFSFNLEHIGHYYNGYLDLMDHWDKVLPNKVICVQYENLVQNTEQQVRQILAHCNLAFENNCLKFYENKRAVKTASSEQVRQPINSKGMVQWKNFEVYLQPLAKILGEQTLKRFSKWH